MSERTALAAATLQAVADALEATRAGLPLAADAAADLAARIARVRAGLTGATGTEALAAAAGDLCDICRDMGRQADPAQAEVQFTAALPLVQAAVPVSLSPAVNLASDLARAVAACVEAACLAEVAVAIAGRSFADRREAQAASARLRGLAESSLERIALLGGEDLWRAASDTVRHAVDYLNAEALDLKPVVLVETLRSFPATVLAWKLYGDPSRAGELVDRNGVSTPLVMPSIFEALAS